jgi:SAM-dependent methyltransferase
MSDQNYSTRVDQEIQAYREVENIHDLPDIYHVWADQYLLPRMQEVLGTGSNVLFYVNEIIKKCGSTTEIVEIVSIGAGYGFLEVEIAQELLVRNLENFQIQCLEISPDLVERANETIRNANVSDFVHFIETDINTWSPNVDESVDIFIANQFLHHVEELEVLFEQIDLGLKPNGIFMTTDVIGRNGHMRWHEAEVILAALWQCLPKRYKYNHQLKRVDTEFVNWDCSVEGFEGIRAQDILPLLVNKFYFQKFFAFGNLTDLFVDRAYGHNFDPLDQRDMAFIMQVTKLNDLLIDLGVIKPTMLFACMSKKPDKTTSYRHWEPDYCIRDPEKEQINPDSERALKMQHQITNWVNELGLKTIDLNAVTQQLATLERRCRTLQAQFDQPSNFFLRLRFFFGTLLRRVTPNKPKK